jgi:hypothetical protein
MLDSVDAALWLRVAGLGQTRERDDQSVTGGD